MWMFPSESFPRFSPSLPAWVCAGSASVLSMFLSFFFILTMYNKIRLPGNVPMTTLFTISIAPAALLVRGLTTASLTAGGLAPFYFSEGRSCVDVDPETRSPRLDPGIGP